MQLGMRIHLAVLFTAFLAGPASATDPTAQQKAWDILDAGAKEKGFTKRAQAIQVLGLLPGDAKAVDMAESSNEFLDVVAKCLAGVGVRKAS